MMSGPVSPHTVLVLLTLSYLVGEMGHFMLGATSRDMARDIGFGDKECVPRGDLEDNVTSEVTQCMTRSREDCDNTTICQWDYTGRGLDYQVDNCYCPQGHLERISKLFLTYQLINQDSSRYLHCFLRPLLLLKYYMLSI